MDLNGYKNFGYNFTLLFLNCFEEHDLSVEDVIEEIQYRFFPQLEEEEYTNLYRGVSSAMEIAP